MSLRCLIKKSLFSCRDCRGITLVELLVALSIGSLLAVGVSQVLQQMFILVPKAENSMLAVRQVQFAGHWIDRDATMAQVITPTPNLFTISTGTPLIISYVSVDTTKTTITYSVDTNKKLQRQVVIINEKTGSLISSSQTQVADSITSITAQYTQPAGQDRKILTTTIFSQIGSASENRTYQTSPRSF
jgi:prepilin-type N-terminal cleavage/methylation domain-containing protein